MKINKNLVTKFYYIIIIMRQALYGCYYPCTHLSNEIKSNLFVIFELYHFPLETMVSWHCFCEEIMWILLVVLYIIHRKGELYMMAILSLTFMLLECFQSFKMTLIHSNWSMQSDVNNDILLEILLFSLFSATCFPYFVTKK